MVAGPAPRETCARGHRRRRASVLSRNDPVSTAWTTPHDVNIARSASVRPSDGARSACWNARGVKCTWLFQNPLVTVAAEQSITVALGGTETSAREPTA